MENKEIISTHDVEERMIVLRNQTVIADADVAALYGVETRRINEAVRNNRNRFPHGYMFELTDRELSDLRSKISTTNISSKSRCSTKVFF